MIKHIVSTRLIHGYILSFKTKHRNGLISFPAFLTVCSKKYNLNYTLALSIALHNDKLVVFEDTCGFGINFYGETKFKRKDFNNTELVEKALTVVISKFIRDNKIKSNHDIFMISFNANKLNKG